ncbi:MAG: hypothetical protein OEZ48_12680 [Candidatus Bathyarchaeota archaeon]|nr:hypothetical protein [Candidatus Bathyarchaeota archaeon]MDH5688700.1 hypothetical protein [Candidatus Bathyarchaeota archaeon]
MAAPASLGGSVGLLQLHERARFILPFPEVIRCGYGCVAQENDVEGLEGPIEKLARLRGHKNQSASIWTIADCIVITASEEKEAF